MTIDQNQTIIQRLIDGWMSKVGEERSLKVRWLFNPDQAPIQGAEIIEHAGVIVDVRSLANSHSKDVWPVIATPPLINCHTHLEFSSLNAPLSPTFPFPDWIRSLIQWRQRQNSEQSNCAIRAGLEESRTAGVSVVGEITTTDLADIEHLSEVHDLPAVVSFREAIGLRSQRINDQFAAAKRHLSVPSSPLVIRGISPHAPYTVHPDLLNALTELAVQHEAPLAMHLAETRDELELLGQGTGRFAEFLKWAELFDTSTFPGGRSIRECLEQIARAPQALVIHGNYLTDDDVSWLQRQSQCSIVYCPRTHAYFGHERYPLEQYRVAGLRVTLGTDSRASNPDLNLLREAQFVASRYPCIPVESIIAMMTTQAAVAIGFDPADFTLLRRDPSLSGGSTVRITKSSMSMRGSARPIITILTSKAEPNDARLAFASCEVAAILRA